MNEYKFYEKFSDLSEEKRLGKLYFIASHQNHTNTNSELCKVNAHQQKGKVYFIAKANIENDESHNCPPSKMFNQNQNI